MEPFKGLKGSKEHDTEKRKKKDPCYIVANNLVEFCSSVLGKVECNEIGYLVKEISIQKKPKPQDLENSHSIHIEKKNDNACGQTITL